jgi:hypothetical protein
MARALKDKGVPGGQARGASGVPAKSSTKRAARKTAADAKSPIQSLKAAVKKAASKSKTRKTRR